MQRIRMECHKACFLRCEKYFYIFVSKCPKRKDGNWGLPGGLMEPGESLEETATREVYEETGLTLNRLTMLELFSGPELYLKLKNGDELYSVTAMYLCNDYRGELVSDSTESHEVRFFDVGKFPNLNPANTIYLAKYLESDFLRKR
ncbi:NUDIX domain-containing protein [Paenibacillus tarimensis]